MIRLIESVLVLDALDLLIQMFAKTLEQIAQVLDRNRFEYIFTDIVTHRLLCIGEFVIPTEDDQCRRRMGDADLLDEFDSIEVGHPDIGDYDIGMQLLDQLQSLDAVSGLAHHTEIVAFPWGAAANPLSYCCLIVNQKNRIRHTAYGSRKGPATQENYPLHHQSNITEVERFISSMKAEVCFLR
ncbi:hypothetical protein SDC9_79850 [bioreactor metagenome]|uniref:Uncharacterized protein n=1 Tax=bioreactor metagenome TaxID=1076179 RepID=A0A644YXD9_9ZZZZ